MYVGLFISRHKDNTNVENFKPRKKTFFTEDPFLNASDFMNFVFAGLPGEMSRFYVSVSPRNMEKTQKQLIHRLIDDPVDLSALNAIATSIAMRAENELEKKWLFDFDCSEAFALNCFLEELEEKGLAHDEIRTPNGYSVIVEHGFDTREFLAKWDKGLKSLNPKFGVELKRNAMVLYHWSIKSGE